MSAFVMTSFVANGLAQWDLIDLGLNSFDINSIMQNRNVVLGISLWILSNCDGSVHFVCVNVLRVAWKHFFPNLFTNSVFLFSISFFTKALSFYILLCVCAICQRRNLLLWQLTHLLCNVK